MRALLAVLAFFVVLLAALPAPQAAENAAPPPDYRVIVNPANATTSLERRFLEDAFLKKTTRWASGEVIRPVDLGPDSSVREKFTEEVLKRSVAAVRSYWQQQIFSGRDVPPPELHGDDEVVSFVLRHEGAIGYVSGTCALKEAKVVSVR